MNLNRLNSGMGVVCLIDIFFNKVFYFQRVAFVTIVAASMSRSYFFRIRKSAMKNAMPIRFSTIFYCLILMSIIFFMYSCNPKKNPTNAEKAYQELQPEEKAWTFLLYDDADFYNAYDPLDDFADKVSSGENVNFIVLQDTEDGPANMWYVDENHNTVLLQEMGEVNMGLSKTLYDFLDYAKTYYTAERYIISFYDHGRAWEGVCWDDTDDHDNLTMDEMQRAFIDAGGVDLVLFSAPCLMGAIESVYELQNCTDVYIGSENFSGYCYWVDTMQDICVALHDNPEIINHQLAGLIIGSIWANREIWNQWPSSLTMSAVRTDKIIPLKEAVEVVAQEYLSNTDAFRTYMDSVYDDIFTFAYNYSDVYDLAEKLLIVEEDAGRRTMLEQMKQCLQDAIIAECHGTSFSNLHGLTIYCPDKSQVSFDYRYMSGSYGLDFSNDTHWDELLQSYIGKRKPIYNANAKRPFNRGDGFMNYQGAQ